MKSIQTQSQIKKIVLPTLLLLVLVACGKSQSGTYQGTESLTGSTLTGSSQNNVTMIISDGQSGKVTGNVTSQYGVSGNLTGTLDGDNLRGVSLGVVTASNNIIGSNNFASMCLQNQNLTGNLQLSGSGKGTRLTGILQASTTNCGLVNVTYDLVKVSE